jgi:ferrochelatase
MRFKGEKNFSHQDKEKIGVLICNLGTPDSYSVSDVRIFLREFLSDKRVIEIPRIIWWFILNFFILTLRPFKSAKIYKSVWTDEGSPLLVYSERLKEKLDRSSPDNLCFELGMRYGNPSIRSALENLKNKNCRKILVLPLFPQYSATTTGSIFDEVTRVISTWRWVPSLNFINSYHDNDNFIDAISSSVKSKFEEINPHKIIFTYHGIPKKYFDQGDPYHCLCQKTSRLVAEKLGIKEENFITTFQSRLGTAEWLKPYTSDVMKKLPSEGCSNILVIAPGFSVDCLETIEEIDEENKEYFLESGGKKFTYINCLNDSDQHIKFLNAFIEQKVSLWN